MYTIIEAFVLERASWRGISITETDTFNPLLQYKEAYLIIQVGGLPKTLKVHEFIKVNPTVKDMAILSTFNNVDTLGITLPFSNGRFHPSKVEGVRIVEAGRIGFSVNRANLAVIPSSSANSVGNDIRLIRTNTDYALFKDTVLLSINGLVFNTSLTENYMGARNGFKAMEKDGLWDCGIIDFSRLGKIHTQQIAFPNIIKAEGQSLINNTTINVNVDVTQKQVGIVIDGFLHLLDDVVSVTGVNLISVDWRKVPLLKRAVRYGGPALSDFELPEHIHALNEETVYGDDYITALLTSRNSFIVMLDRTDLVTYKGPVTESMVSGKYTSMLLQGGVARDTLGHTLSFKEEVDFGGFVLTPEPYRLLSVALPQNPISVPIDSNPKNVLGEGFQHGHNAISNTPITITAYGVMVWDTLP